MENKEVFKKALAFVLLSEGGYVNDPRDKGGMTYKGVTQLTYNAYLVSKGKSVKPIAKEYTIGSAPKNAKTIRYKNKDVVVAITDTEIEDIYYKKYWCATKCDTMAPAMATVVFDTAVNMGVAKPSEYFKELGYNITVSQFLDRRMQSYNSYVKHDATQEVFLKGWTNRVNALRKFVAQFK